MAADDYELAGLFDDEAPRDPTHAADPKLPAAKDYLKNRFFSRGARRVYYQRQLQVLSERKYFLWITAAAVMRRRLRGGVVARVLDTRIRRACHAAATSLCAAFRQS